MAGITIPGVSDKYGTTDLIASLMEVERLPLKHEQETLDGYKVQQNAWRNVNRQMSTLRESVRTLFSFENPFNSKTTASSNEAAVSATANRNAEFQTFKVDVLNTAHADRFLSGGVEKDMQVPAGRYTYTVGDKPVAVDWKGGKLTDFAAALNKRGNGLVKASLVGVSAGKQALLIESLKTGAENRLGFQDAAFDFAVETRMISSEKAIENEPRVFGENAAIVPLDTRETAIPASDAKRILEFTIQTVDVEDITIAKNAEAQKTAAAAAELAAQKAAEAAAQRADELAAELAAQERAPETEAAVPEEIALDSGINTGIVADTVTEDAGDEAQMVFGAWTEGNEPVVLYQGEPPKAPAMPQPVVKYQSEPQNPSIAQSAQPVVKYQVAPVTSPAAEDPAEIAVELENPVESNEFVWVRDSAGKETFVDTASISADSEGARTVVLRPEEYPDIAAIIVRNKNTGKEVLTSEVTERLLQDAGPFAPLNPVEIAADAKLKYEGVTIERATNSIDDIVPGVTIALHAPTDKTATIKIEPDTDAAKDSLITFVGHYNQVIAELNILSQNNPALVSELDYLSANEQEAALTRLGLFLGDFTLTNAKSALFGIVAGNYQIPNNSTVSMLSQIGIATQADSSGGFNASRLRGYLEIDEKKLDTALQNNIAEVKNLFGHDSDGDFIIDSGIAYQLDQRLQTYTQRDGIFTTKASSLDGKISTSETKISRLEKQLDTKEAQLKQKYGQMEATLNGLERQSTSLDNFSRQSQNNR